MKAENVETSFQVAISSGGIRLSRKVEAPNGILLCDVLGRYFRLPRSTPNRTVMQIIFVIVALGLLLFPGRFIVARGGAAAIIVLHLFMNRGGHDCDIGGDVSELRSAFPNRRLVAIDREDVLNEIADLEDAPFEPVVIAQVEAPLRLRRQFAFGLFPALALNAAVGSLTTGAGVLNFIATCLLIGLLIHVVTLRIRPAYYRMTPGRLEYVRSRILRREANCEILDIWDLRTAEIWLVRGMLMLASAERRPTEIHCLFTEAPWDMWNAVFHAAISTHDSPPPPTDRVYP